MRQISSIPKFIVTVCHLLLVICANGQELPFIKTFGKADHNAQRQTWDIAQLADGTMLFANSAGLLMYDGTNWDLYPMPDRQILRTIGVKNDTIYAGAYGEIGHWSFSPRTLAWEYKSLNDTSTWPNLAQEEVWNIINHRGDIIFQSFGSIYRLSGGKLSAVSVPTSIQFLHPVGESLLLQVNDHGLYRADGDSLLLLSSDTELVNPRITGIHAMDENRIVVANEDGLLLFYEYDQTTDRLSFVHSKVSADVQINRTTLLSTGKLSIATVRHGLAIVDPSGSRTFRLDKSTGLPNNTILSLFEDDDNRLWLGLDEGIALVNVNSDLLFWEDRAGRVGTPFAATLYRSGFYLATNQGLYARDKSSQTDEFFQLVPGTEGQVWNLTSLSDYLLIAHNRGMMVLDTAGNMTHLEGSGIWSCQVLQESPLVFAAATYNGVKLFKEVEGTISAYDQFLDHAARWMVYHQSDLWVSSPYKGVSRIEVDTLNWSLGSVESYSTRQGLPHDFRIKFQMEDQQLLASTLEGRYYYESSSDTFLPRDIGESKSRLARSWVTDDVWITKAPQQTELYLSDQGKRVLPFSLPAAETKARALQNGQIWFALDNGYALVNASLHRDMYRIATPAITRIESYDNRGSKLQELRLRPPYQPIEITAAATRIRILFADRSYESEASFRSKLEPLDGQWTRWEGVAFREFTNLSAGEYHFNLESSVHPQVSSCSFRVLPRWHETVIARIFFALLVVGLALGAAFWYQWRLQRHKRLLSIEHERELNRQKLILRNEALERSIRHKSKELANSTFSLTQKNDVLSNILEGLREVKVGLGVRFPDKYYQRLIRLIERNLSSEQDEQLFETNFGDVHDDFFAQLQRDYPDLSPGELKLAGYLKMNLSSKEIAQLLHISVRGVENKRYRLRKKMELEPGENLVAFLIKY